MARNVQSLFMAGWLGAEERNKESTAISKMFDYITTGIVWRTNVVFKL